MTDLPEPRRDGVCCSCGQKPAVTKDGRFCKSCLKKVIAHDTPMVGCYPKSRADDKRENTYETKHGRD